MANFEGEMVDAFNSWFDEYETNGVAYRIKQAKYTSQKLDVLVDSPEKYIGIECKSLKLDSNKKLYFSQHFSKSEKGHQVKRATQFLENSGREGYLAIEIRRGKGHSKRAFIIPWNEIKTLYDNNKTGVNLEKLMGNESKVKSIELSRIGGEYLIPNEIMDYDIYKETEI